MWGTTRAPGLLEIKFNMPKTRNANYKPENVAELINAAQSDKNIKVILLHGGKYFGSGNNLKDMAAMASMTQEEKKITGQHGIFEGLAPYLMAINGSVKPIVCVVRGGAFGIGFTALALADFVYASPDAQFNTPFMKTFQSPEGSSSYSFPQQFGKRKSMELLLLDKLISAQEAQDSGFINEIIPSLQAEPEWFDLSKVPAISKLLATDYRTLTNAKSLLNQAKDNKAVEETIEREGHGLLNTWLDESFPNKMKTFMAQMAAMKKKEVKAKL